MERDEIGDVLAAIETHFSDRLSTWEEEFIESVTEQHEAGRLLSERQQTKLSEIFEKVSRGGRG
jgi:hypothetical protein